MKILTALLFLVLILFSGFTPSQGDNVELVCVKTHRASNTCYFNFRVDGGKYSYTDSGCRKMKRKEEIIKKVKEGKLALSKDWKIECQN
jgi:hypothetical protein